MYPDCNIYQFRLLSHLYQMGGSGIPIHLCIQSPNALNGTTLLYGWTIPALMVLIRWTHVLGWHKGGEGGSNWIVGRQTSSHPESLVNFSDEEMVRAVRTCSEAVSDPMLLENIITDGVIEFTSWSTRTRDVATYPVLAELFSVFHCIRVPPFAQCMRRYSMNYQPPPYPSHFYLPAASNFIAAEVDRMERS
jgi:hypothetical protein